MTEYSDADRIECGLCSHRDFYLVDHILQEHGLSLEEYQAAVPDAPVVARVLWDEFEAGESNKRRKTPPPLDDLTVKIRGLTFKVNHKVPEDACLPLPPFYRVPTQGSLSKDIGHAAIALLNGRSLYVWGLPGSGKDALFHAVSNLTRMPGQIFSIQPGADVQSWFCTRGFDQNGTFWEEGLLLKCLRDGYKAADGSVHPYMILITDFDRADRSQAEALRLVLDSIQGRVVTPDGKTHKVLAGTRFAVTANTSGGGDVRGRMVSSNPLDASIMDRFQVKVEFHQIDWADEEIICRAKFPTLARVAPEVFAVVGKCTNAIRAEVDAENLHWEFSHRAVCNWLQHCEDLYVMRGKVDSNLLKRGARVVLDGAPDPETRTAARKLMDPHISMLKSTGVEGGDPDNDSFD